MKVDATDEEIKEIYEYVQVLLGGTHVDVEIKESEIRILLRKALKEYLEIVDNWQIRDDFDNIIGFSSQTDFTNKFVTENFNIAQQISNWISSMARVGGKTPWKVDYFTTTGTKQIYDLSQDSSDPYRPGTRRIHKIMWQARPEIIGTPYDAYGVDPELIQWGYGGMMYNGTTLNWLGNLFDVMLLGQSMEMKKKVVRSEFFYNISGDIVELTPLPGNVGAILPEGSRVFYYYFNEEDALGLEDQSDISSLISSPFQVKINVIPYSELNSVAKNWLEDYTVALCKYMYGSKLRQIKKIASPDSEYQIEFDYQSLIDESKTEVEELKKRLNDLLDSLDFHKLMEDKAAAVKDAAFINARNPRKIFCD